MRPWLFVFFAVVLSQPTLSAGSIPVPAAKSVSLCYGKSVLMDDNGEGPLGDVMRTLFRRVDPAIQLKLQILPWKRCQSAVAAGHVDGVMRLLRTPEREPLYYFSAPMHKQYSYFPMWPNGIPRGWHGSARKIYMDLSSARSWAIR